jgi:hypothetical protein
MGAPYVTTITNWITGVTRPKRFILWPMEQRFSGKLHRPFWGPQYSEEL